MMRDNSTWKNTRVLLRKTDGAKKKSLLFGSTAIASEKLEIGK
jgi:hypothetical protein